MVRRIFVGISLVFVSLFLPGNVNGATLNVPSVDYPTIQAGIDAAADGDIVLVADGIYTGDGNRDIDFGGKAITVKSENGPDLTIIDCQGGPTDEHRGFYFHHSEGPNSVLEGFTIRSGYVYPDCGGGISCYTSSPTINNCIITGNFAYSGGGICCVDYSSPAVTNCNIAGNSASYDGGGIYCLDSSPTITNCIITENGALDNGGGISCYSSSSSPTITNSIIAENSADNCGGGIYCYFSSPTITNSTITGNSGLGGGGMCFEFSSLYSPTITNCILWNDVPDEIFNHSSVITISYSDVQGGLEGEGNIDSDPLLVGGGDYHLQPGSPCIDTGTSGDAPHTDFEGDTRPQGCSHDMGADEYVTGRIICSIIPTHGGYETEVEVKGSGFSDEQTAMINDQDGYYSFVTFSGQPGTMIATVYYLWSDIMINVQFKNLFIDTNGNYLKDVSEPFLTVDQIPPDDYDLAVTTIWFHDINGNNMYDIDDEVYDTASTNTQPFTLEPLISYIYPSSVPGVTTSFVKIVGKGFGSTQGNGEVHLGQIAMGPGDPRIYRWTSTKINFYLPKDYSLPFPKWREVWVTVNGVDSNKVWLEITGLPLIDYLNPAQVPGVSTSKVRIIGSNLGNTQGSSQIHVGGQVLGPGNPNILYWNNTRVKCWLPEVFWNPPPTKDRWKEVWVTVNGEDSNKVWLHITQP